MRYLNAPIPCPSADALPSSLEVFWSARVRADSLHPYLLIEHVRVDHCRRQIRMAEQFLNRADVIGRLQQVRGERVAEGMATRPLRDARLPDR